MKFVIGTSLLFISVVFLNSIQLSSQGGKKPHFQKPIDEEEVRPPFQNVPAEVPAREHPVHRNIRPSTVPNDILFFRGNIPPEAATYLESRALPIPYGQFYGIVNNNRQSQNQNVLRDRNVLTNEQWAATHEHLQRDNPNENITSPNEDVPPSNRPRPN